MVEAKTITVDCYRNDGPDDLKWGGPAILGFDFLVRADANSREYVRLIEKELAESEIPLMGQAEDL